MERTYPREIELTDDQYALIDRVRDRIGDSIMFKHEYMDASQSAVNAKLVAGGMSYYDPVNFYWPYNIVVNGTTYSGVTNPSVSRYQYLEFTTVSGGGTLKGKVIDFGLETFKLSDKTIWNTYQNVDLTGLVTVPEYITDYMIFLKCCLDLCKILRTRLVGSNYSYTEIVDADTRFTKDASRSGADPYKDLYSNIEQELNAIIDSCNRQPYTGGIRIEGGGFM